MLTLKGDKMYNKEILIKRRDLIETFTQVIDTIIHMVYQDKVSEGIQLVLELMDVLTNNESVREIAVNEIQLINQIFTSLVSSIEKKDYVLTCDLLEYELLPVFLNWKKTNSLELNNTYGV